jgi:hypothetical protein
MLKRLFLLETDSHGRMGQSCIDMIIESCKRANECLAASDLFCRSSHVSNSGMNANRSPVKIGHAHCSAKTARYDFGVVLETSILTNTSPIACMKNMQRIMADWMGPWRRIGEISDAQAVAVAKRQPIAEPLIILPASNMLWDVAPYWTPTPAIETRLAPTRGHFLPSRSDTNPIKKPPRAWRS